MKLSLVVASMLAAFLPSLLIADASAQQERKEDIIVHEEKESQKAFREMIENRARALSLQDAEEYSIIELIDFMMVVRITKQLGLNDDESLRLFQCIHSTLDEIHRLKWERGAIHHYLRIDLDRGAEDSLVRAKLDRAMEIETELATLIKKLVEEGAKTLETKQEAELFLFSFDFESEITKLIEQAEIIAEQRHGPVSGQYNPRDEPDEDEGLPELQGDRR